MQPNTPPHFHPWHHVHYGDHAPEVVNAIIEIPSGSMGKFELDKTTGLIRLDRVLFSSVHYPANYGFIPRTYGEDKDPLDILVFTSIELPHLCQAEARVIGVMRMIDQGEADDKIIAVAARDMSVKHLENIEELPAHTLNQLQRFFEDYKKLENKEVVVENFLPRAEAFRIIRESIARYQDHFSG
jgi:inorganic pyrophosphatase